MTINIKLNYYLKLYTQTRKNLGENLSLVLLWLFTIYVTFSIICSEYVKVYCFCYAGEGGGQN